MKKILAILVAGLFSVGAFAQTTAPAGSPAPHAQVAKTKKASKAKHHKKHSKKSASKAHAKAM